MPDMRLLTKAMMEDCYYPSVGAGMIRYRRWEPECEPCAVVQIVHGIAEHIERYDDFAAFLNQQGFLVVAEDHMGHGKSCGDLPRGYFHGGWFAAVADTIQLLKITHQKYPNIPYILLGHSMGSFMARTILADYPDSGIAGCILSGTGWMPDFVLTMGKTVASIVCKTSGEEKPSNLLQNLMFGSYNKRIEHPRTAFDWLTRDEDIVDTYVSDPNCGFVASAGLCRDMLNGMQYIQKDQTLCKMNTETPVYFIAGQEDPVGHYGSGVLQASEKFVATGMKKVSTKLHPLCRHEILNELTKTEVYSDIAEWIKNI